MVIDFHTNLGCTQDFETEAEMLLREMDANGVDKAVVCPDDRYLAVYNSEGNDGIASVVRQHPDRFIGFGCASPWYGDKAVNEVSRIAELGLKGLKVHSFYQGFLLCDHILDPVLDACRKARLPVLAHTGTPVSATPFQLRELAIRFPDVAFIMGHMGYADFWYDITAASKDLDNIYLEWSYALHSWIEDAIDNCGIDRILFGSDWPYSREKIEIEKANLACNTEERKKMLGGNAARLLGIVEDVS